jgi:dCMP deaminase
MAALSNWRSSFPRSKDPSTKVGAVLVRPDRTIAAVGFNGFARGVVDHEERYADRPTKYEMVVHAELNALLNARESVAGHTLYVTPLPPCSQCAAAIVQQGLKRVVIAMKKDLPLVWADKWKTSKTMFNEAGVAIYEMPEHEFRQSNSASEPTSP